MGREEPQHRNELFGSGESFVQARDVSGGIHLHAPRAPRPRQLPLPIGNFTGREPELAELDAVLDGHVTEVVISAVSGTAGVGKTALAIQWAHRVRHRFPDGQLYADLRGYDRERPLDPAEVLARFLRALGDADVPDDPEERAARYRTLVADRRVLVVLDNARTATQVLPLLPGSPSCFVIVTSRDSLPTLRVRYRARGVNLDRLPTTDAVRLLRSSIGTRVDDSPHDAAALVELCARLPLALRITAEVAATRPRASLAELASELADERRLLGLAEDDRTIRTVFSWSTGQLDDDCRDVFRLLGLHPGRQYDTAAVAALAGVDPAAADRLLDALLRVHLLEVGSDGRFGMHDLLAAYARELAEEFPPGTANQAFSRLFEHYARTARAARTDVDGWFDVERLNFDLVAQHAEHHDVPASRLAEYEHDLALVNRTAGDIPHALRHFSRARTYATADRLDLIEVDQAETMIAAGIHSEACDLFDDLRLRLGDDHPLRARLDQHHAIAELARDNAARAASLAEAARVRFSRSGDHRAAATSALTHLAATTVEPELLGDARPAARRRALAIAAELTTAGLSHEAEFALLLGVRVVIADGDLDLAARLMPEGSAGQHSIDYRMLLRLCWAEIALKLDKGDDVLFEAAAALSHADPERSTRLSPVPAGALYRRRLRDLALDVVVERHDPAALLAFTERARVQRLKYAPTRPVAPPEAATVEKVARAIGDRALVSFVTVWDELFALVVTSDGASVVGLGTAEVIFEAAHRLHADISTMAPDHLPTSLTSVLAASAERQARTLDVLLMRPPASLLRDRELVIVPTGPLHSLAWSALASLRAVPLVVAPSVTAWLASEAGVPSGGPKRVVLAAGPGLPAATREQDGLARIHRDPTVLTVGGARVAEVLAASDGAAIVHLAAHGVNEPENALFSRLELIDGPLYAHEFGRLRRPPRQVVLAACELAGGHVEPDDDALGFADALLHAGVSTVIVAIGHVGDETTAIAMQDYHRALAAGRSPARALADAVAPDPLRRPFICVGSGQN